MLAVVCPGRGTALPATGRRWSRTSLPRARISGKARRPDRGGARGLPAVQHKPDRSRRTNKDVEPGDQPALTQMGTRNLLRNGFQVPEAFRMRPVSGRAKTASVIDAITRQANRKESLPVLILKIPNNPILQSCALPDYNYGATLAYTRPCVHVSGTSSNLLRVALPACAGHLCRHC